MEFKKKLLSSIPSVDELLKKDKVKDLISMYPRDAVVDGIREYLSEYRKLILSAKAEDLEESRFDENYLIDGLCAKVHSIMSNKLIHVINATGVVIHTNLGRALLSHRIKDSLWGVASHYSNLELNVAEGIRGSRYSHVEEIICKITGAEAAMVVNNNAAAVMLVLNTMAKDKEVIVSRGQLVEIGGSFRVPDVMAGSGAKLVEVGTTNKTHIWDYERAVNENTAALMKVHTSNFKILGFTKEVESEELVALGRKLGLPVIEDLGSGVLLDLSKYGLPYEPTVQSAVKAGMDVVTFSGDKMLGGPQAGIIVGSKAYIDKMKKNPLTRAFRIDKLTLAALEGTLKLYLDEKTAVEEIPVLRMLTYTETELEKRARKLLNKLKKSVGSYCSISVESEWSEVGGGSMPTHKMPTRVIAINTSEMSLDTLDKKLRDYKVPVISRIYKEKLILDIRTIQDDEFEVIENAFKYVFKDSVRKERAQA